MCVILRIFRVIRTKSSRYSEYPGKGLQARALQFRVCQDANSRRTMSRRTANATQQRVQRQRFPSGIVRFVAI